MHATQATAPGMRWATFCIFYLYPVHALGCISLSLWLWQIGTPGAQALAIAAALGTLAFGAGAVWLLESSIAGWRLNWLLVGGIILFHAALAATYVASGLAGPAVGKAVVVASMLVWFLAPSIVYWRRRAHLFHEFPNAPLRLQWTWLPAATWLLLVAVVGASVAIPVLMRAGNIHPAPVAQAADSRPAIIDPFKAPAALTPEQQEAAAQATWESDVEAFLRTRCELTVTTESSRAQVAENLRLFQFAINAVMKPGMSNMELLVSAGEHVYTYTGYTPRGYCPD